MSNVANISVSLKFNQIVDLMKQLPKKQQQQLIGMLEQSQSSTSSKKLSQKETSLLKGLDGSIEFVNKYQRGKSRHKSFKQMLDEL